MDDLARLLNASRPDFERAIAKARLELDACEARCRELGSLIETAEAVVGLEPSGGGRGKRERTLRAAMKSVLRSAPMRRLPAPEIAAAIRERDLYRRPNGTAVDVGQIHNRVHHYPDEFLREDGFIRLANGVA